jgi:hypothetical protein
VLPPGCCGCELSCVLALGSIVKGAASIALRPVPGVMRPTGGVAGPPSGAVLRVGRVFEGGTLGATALAPVPDVIAPTRGDDTLPPAGAVLLAGMAPVDPPLLGDAAPRAALPVCAPTPTPPVAPAPPPPCPAARTLLELKTAAKRTTSAKRMEPRGRTGLSYCGMRRAQAGSLWRGIGPS